MVSGIGAAVFAGVDWGTVALDARVPANMPSGPCVTSMECNRVVLVLPCRYVNVVVNVKVMTCFPSSWNNDDSFLAADALLTGAFPNAATVVPFVPLPLAVTAKYWGRQMW